jgi:hypothetical protein
MPRNSRRKPQVQQLDDRLVPAGAAVSGLVFADLNASGVQEAGEPALGGVVVQLSDADNKVEKATQTAADGSFTLDNVADGPHQVTVIPTGSAGVNASIVTKPITVTGAEAVGPVTFGLGSTGKVSGAVFADVNGNARRDDGEPGIGGATATLNLFGGGLSTLTTATAADGSYSFSGVPDGQHKLVVTAAPGYQPNSPHTTVTLVGGATARADAGFRPTSAVSGQVTLGPSAADGPGVPGVSVALDLNADAKTDAVTTTDANGNYLFSNVPAGTHTVTVTAPGGSSFDTADKSNRLVVSTTGDIKAGNDIGITYPGKVTGEAFLDGNGNGKQDGTDQPLQSVNVQVDLFNTGKLVPVEAQPNADGTFTVKGIPDGTHTVVLTPPGGYEASTGTRYPVTVTNGGTAEVPAVGYEAAGGATVAVGAGETSGAAVYSFTRGANGTLIATQGQTTTLTGKTGASTRTAAADVNGDGVDDLITGNGPGGAPVVRIYDGRTRQELVPNGILAFEPSFTGGLNLSAGDFLKTGKAQLVVSADTGGGPRVRVIDPTQYMTGADPTRSKVLADFFGIDDPNFRGGARTAVGDLNADGSVDLVVAAGTGGGPRVAVFDGRTVGGGVDPTRLTADFFAFEPALRNGAVVAVGDLNGNGGNDLIVGAGPGGSPRVTVFDGRGIVAGKGADGQRLADFFVNNDSTSRLGTRLTVKDLDADGKADVVATNGGRAYVFTSQSILATYLTGETPAAAAVLNPFPLASTKGGLFVG